MGLCISTRSWTQQPVSLTGTGALAIVVDTGERRRESAVAVDERGVKSQVREIEEGCGHGRVKAVPVPR